MILKIINALYVKVIFYILVFYIWLALSVVKNEIPEITHVQKLFENNLKIFDDGRFETDWPEGKWKHKM